MRSLVSVQEDKVGTGELYGRSEFDTWNHSINVKHICSHNFYSGEYLSMLAPQKQDPHYPLEKLLDEGKLKFSKSLESHPEFITSDRY